MGVRAQDREGQSEACVPTQEFQVLQHGRKCPVDTL
jgi:hypothetical protein